MFGTNRALRATIAYLRSELNVARGNVAEAVGHRKVLEEEYKAAIAKLDEELNGSPADYGMYTFKPGTRGVRGELDRARRDLGAAYRVEDGLRKDNDRLTRHNQALRDALTALGGAVIELQDHVEVRA